MGNLASITQRKKVDPAVVEELPHLRVFGDNRG
jgi:hypothetical protein